LSSFKEKNDYRIYSSVIAGAVKYIRPINKILFIETENGFSDKFDELKIIFGKIKSKSPISENEKSDIDKTLYTIQQSIGAGLDLLVNPNSARKHVGNRFEELVKIVFNH